MKPFLLAVIEEQPGRYDGQSLGAINVIVAYISERWHGRHAFEWYDVTGGGNEAILLAKVK